MANQEPILRYAVVKDNNDPTGTNRIQVASLDDGTRNDTIERTMWVLPGMPQVFKVTPKIGELVYVIFPDGDVETTLAYYIGPLIGIPDQMENAVNAESAKYFKAKDSKEDLASNEIRPESLGCFANRDDVAIYGRKNSEMILGDDFAAIRCGARKPVDGRYELNTDNPSLILMDNKQGEAVTTILSEDINLFAVEQSPIEPQNEANNPALFQKNDIEKLMKKAHVLPYGDVLVEFLQEFVEVFSKHYHTYPGLPPDPKSKNNTDLYEKTSRLKQNMLSQHVRIN